MCLWFLGSFLGIFFRLTTKSIKEYDELEKRILRNCRYWERKKSHNKRNHHGNKPLEVFQKSVVLEFDSFKKFYLRPMFHFCTLWKHQKNGGHLVYFKLATSLYNVKVLSFITSSNHYFLLVLRLAKHLPIITLNKDFWMTNVAKTGE